MNRVLVPQSLRLMVLITALGLSSPTAGAAQDDDAAIGPVEIGLVGLTVDIEDGKRLGDGCLWRTHEDPEADGCTITYATIEEAGFLVVGETEASLTAGDFGPERYRMAGRVTDLHYREPLKVNNRDNYIEQQGELITDADGRVLGRMPTVRTRARGGLPMPAQVTATVEWSIYDRGTEQIVVTREVKGRARDLGSALYDSMDEFVEGLLDQ